MFQQINVSTNQRFNKLSNLNPYNYEHKENSEVFR